MMGLFLICIAFVTGNEKKLEEVKYILNEGNLDVTLKSRALDCTGQPLKSI